MLSFTVNETTDLPIWRAIVVSLLNGTGSLARTSVPNLDKLSSSEKRPSSLLYLMIAWHRDTEISETLTSESWPLPSLN